MGDLTMWEAMNNKRRRGLSKPITGRLSEGRGSGNYRPFVGGQAVTNSPESGAGGSGHKRIRGHPGLSATKICLESQLYARTIVGGTGGGARTPTSSRTPDFESSASANSATPARCSPSTFRNRSAAGALCAGRGRWQVCSDPRGGVPSAGAAAATYSPPTRPEDEGGARGRDTRGRWNSRTRRVLSRTVWN